MTLEKALMKAASEVNKSCPQMVDQDTRLDNAMALPENDLQYNYTLVNLSKEDLNIKEFENYMIPQITNDVKTNPGLQIFREKKVTMKFYYRDKNGESITLIEVSPKEYN